MIDNDIYSGRSTTLDVMLDALSTYEVPEGADCRAVYGISADSRAVVPGSVFVAVRGVAVDGHTFIDKAIEAGATTVVCEELPAEIASDVTYIKVPDSREALGRLASRFFGDPSDELTLVGVTGTNGKTTIATLLYEPASYRRLPILSTEIVCRQSIRLPTQSISTAFCAGWLMPDVLSHRWRSAATPVTSTG